MKERTTIVNFVIDEKFIDGVIDYNKQFSPCDVVHLYVLVCDRPLEQFTLIKNSAEIIQLKPEEVISFLREKHADAVILHSLYSLPLQIIPMIPREICVIWSSWGYDLYSMMGTFRLVNMNLFRPLTRDFLKVPPVSEEKDIVDDAYKEAVHRIDFLSTVLPEEFEIIPSLPYFHAKELHYTYITPKEVEAYQNAGDETNVGENILVGNSGAPTNNHLDVFEKLSVLDIGDRKIYCPLSYAGYPLEYKNEVIEQGRRFFGRNFVPLLDFLDKETYFSIIHSCGYAFFGHIRQQALGNIREMLIKGHKVFLDEDSPMYKHFRNFGVKVFSLQDDSIKEQLLTPLSQTEIHNNISVLKQEITSRRCYSEMSFMLYVIRKHKKRKPFLTLLKKRFSNTFHIFAHI